MTSRGVAAFFADNLGFAIPVYYVKQFIHHREAFAFDKANPNSGYRYLDPPRRQIAGQPEGLKDRSSGATVTGENRRMNLTERGGSRRRDPLENGFLQ